MWIFASMRRFFWQKMDGSCCCEELHFALLKIFWIVLYASGVLAQNELDICGNVTPVNYTSHRPLPISQNVLKLACGMISSVPAM